ncbi:outer membrane protein assembly factor [Thalassotalea sp. LPB0316]|uniref:autotransporter assembly complex protein TamA n=1 Tax=Thalassotalea sp. LPB0316 TaxID=2769490 RepID=UPI0018676FED|nr:autotransporter assembly complex family protein [Thalassotalea sp. LPB0316]QOL25227.1 outer membrane protein assembly factor [Thalassotalea sp. LPB0316]
MTLTRYFAAFVAICVISVCCPTAYGQNLRVVLIGTDKQQSANILAHLGKLPETPAHRNNFIFNTEKAATKAMAAIGYYQPTINTAVDRKQEPWVMTLTIEPGPATLWHNIAIDVIGEASQLSEFNNLGAEMGIVPGKRMQHDQYEKVKTTLINRAIQRGFFDGQLSLARLEVDRTNNLANVLISYHSGRRYVLGDVSFTGTTLQPELLEQLIPFEPNTPYDQEHISRLNSELIQTEYFSSIKVYPAIEQRNEYEVPVNIELSPTHSHNVTLGLGYTTNTKERASVTWHTPQINKYGHSQKTKIEYSKVNPYARFLYEIPLSHPTKDFLQLQLGLESNDYADISSNMQHAQIGHVHNIQGWVAQYYFRYLAESWDILSDPRNSKFLLPGLSLAKTKRRGKVTDPESGLRQLYQIEAGFDDFMSDSNIVRARARFTWVERFWQDHRLVIRGDLGASYFDDKLLDDVPPSLRFYAGGDGSIRGFSYQSLGPSISYTDDNGIEQEITVGGRYLSVGSIEHQYYLNDEWRVNLFTDFGSAYDHIDDLKLSYSVGTGIHWLSLIGPIKLELARSISEQQPGWRIHINIGAEL